MLAAELHATPGAELGLFLGRPVGEAGRLEDSDTAEPGAVGASWCPVSEGADSSELRIGRLQEISLALQQKHLL